MNQTPVTSVTNMLNEQAARNQSFFSPNGNSNLIFLIMLSFPGVLVWVFFEADPET